LKFAHKSGKIENKPPVGIKNDSELFASLTEDLFHVFILFRHLLALFKPVEHLAGNIA